MFQLQMLKIGLDLMHYNEEMLESATKTPGEAFEQLVLANKVIGIPQVIGQQLLPIVARKHCYLLLRVLIFSKHVLSAAQSLLICF